MAVKKKKKKKCKGTVTQIFPQDLWKYADSEHNFKL